MWIRIANLSTFFIYNIIYRNILEMNIFKRIINWVKKIKTNYINAVEDIRNKKSFIAKVKADLKDRNSFFYMYNLKVDTDNYTQVIQVINIPREFQIAGQDWQIKDKLDETAYVVSRYLKTELGYNDNITGPEFYHIEDPTSDSISTEYLGIWNYVYRTKYHKTYYILNTVFVVLSLLLISIPIYIFLI